MKTVAGRAGPARPLPGRRGVQPSASFLEVSMSSARIAIAAALAAALAAPAAVQAQGASEKCYGVAKAGKNDCQTDHSSCAGTSKKDAQTDAWIAVPKGTCAKIVGGKLTSS
jgi:uncharacterized membrane protein